ncbi:MAG: ABC transporter permease [bacterium]|nr:ABC transporter permease [bacterium]
MPTLKKILPPIVAIVIILIIWQACLIWTPVNGLLLSAPTEIFFALYSNLNTIIYHCAISLFEATAGLILGASSAYLLSLLLTLNSTLKNTIYPLAIAFKAVPVIAVAPLLVLWFGSGCGSKIAVAALLSFFPVLVGSVNGLSDIDRSTRDYLSSLAISRRTLLLKISIPLSLPQFFTSMKVASSLSIVGAIVGEFTGSSMGAGYLINTASYYLQTPLMFAVIVLMSLGSLGLFGAICWLESKIIYWKLQD